MNTFLLVQMPEMNELKSATLLLGFAILFQLVPITNIQGIL